MKKIRILYVITGLNVGGAEIMLYRMIGAINRDIFEIAVISLLSGGEVAKRIESDYKIPVVSLNIEERLRQVKVIYLLGREIKKWKPDLVHSHMYHANIVTRLARLFYPMPVLINTIHNIDESGKRFKSRIRLFIYQITNRLCDLVSQVSRAGMEKYLALKAVSALKILYLPNGIDITTIETSENEIKRLKANLNLTNQFLCLAVGSLTKQKDYPNLLEAFSIVLKGYRNTVLLIAGGGPLEKKLKATATAYKIADRVRFLGMRNDIPAVMKMADAYVMSSAWEGMPIVLLEAAAAGLPIVATDVGGNSEIVVNEENGLLVPPHNPGALAAAMEKVIMMSEDERSGLGKRVQNYVRDHYSLESVTAKWETIYRDNVLRNNGDSTEG